MLYCAFACVGKLVIPSSGESRANQKYRKIVEITIVKYEV
jgi:hypothetical protein